MKILLMAVSLFYAGSIFAGDTSIAFVARSKTDKETYMQNIKEINAADVLFLGVELSLDPADINQYDRIKISAHRWGNTEGETSIDRDFARSKLSDDKNKKGNKMYFPRIFDYRKGENGPGDFTNYQYRQNLTASFWLSKKGNDYSTSKPADSYTLTVTVTGLKIIKYVKMKNDRGEWVNEPQYSSVKLGKAAMTVRTTDSVKPLEKSSVVHDQEEALDFMKNNPQFQDTKK